MSAKIYVVKNPREGTLAVTSVDRGLLESEYASEQIEEMTPESYRAWQQANSTPAEPDAEPDRSAEIEALRTQLAELQARLDALEAP